MNGKVKAFLLLVVMYGLGLASGILWITRHNHADFCKSPDFVERRTKKLSSRLHLTPDQSQTVHGILQHSHQRAKKAHDQIAQEMSVIHRDSTQSPRQVLCPAQTAEFEHL